MSRSVPAGSTKSNSGYRLCLLHMAWGSWLPAVCVAQWVAPSPWYITTESVTGNGIFRDQACCEPGGLRRRNLTHSVLSLSSGCCTSDPTALNLPGVEATCSMVATRPGSSHADRLPVTSKAEAWSISTMADGLSAARLAPPHRLHKASNSPAKWDRMVWGGGVMGFGMSGNSL